jgi:hypothetical protein
MLQSSFCYLKVKKANAVQNDPSFNTLPYIKLNMGNAWREWIKEQQPIANTAYLGVST